MCIRDSNNLAENYAYKKPYDKRYHLLLKYGRKMLNPESQNVELRGNIKGKSGGGLWYINDPTLLDISNPPVSLVGILNDFDKNYICSTRFHIVYQFVRDTARYHRKHRILKLR